MLTKGLRLYGKNDVRLESFELPPIKEDEILAKVVSDSLCMSSYKAAIQGADHKRVPNDVAENPILLGHECCGEIVEVGALWADQFKPGQRFVIQPALNYKGSIDAPGYSFPYIGGTATYIVIPHQVMELGCLIPYNAEAFFYGSLSEPVSCVIGSYREMFHTTPGIHEHKMGIKPGGSLAIIAGAGPMGLAAIDYAIHAPIKPSRVVVTDMNQSRLDYASSILSKTVPEGVELLFVNTGEMEDAASELIKINGGQGFDDVLAMAPVRAVAELADSILGTDGCLSFFAGPTDKAFKSEINFYNVHYNATHVIGTVGGNQADMEEAVVMMEEGTIDPAFMITHVGGMDASAEATMNLPNIPGGKKLIYTHAKMELTALTDFEEKGRTDKHFAELAAIIKKNNGIWCLEAEKYVLENMVDESLA